MKQICVIGLGNFGSHLAKTLAEMRCEVLAIDIDENRVAQVRDYVQQALIADVRDFNTLQAVVSRDVDEAVISLGDDLGGSILCALHLKNLGLKSIRAKASDEDHAQILEALGVTEVFFPEQETASRMARRIIHPNLLDFFPLGETHQVVEMEAPERFHGKTLEEARVRKEYNCFVIAVRKGGVSKLQLMPPADYALGPKDVLMVLGESVDLQRFSTGD